MAQHLFLPVVTLTVGYLGAYSLVMRSSLIEVKDEEFVTVARAKGMRDREVLRREVVPNARLPIFTMVVLYFGYVIGGAVRGGVRLLAPGVSAQLTVDAIQAQDFPVMQAVFLLLSVSVIAANFIADVVYVYLDPRVRT